jgi:hypothetical protein
MGFGRSGVYRERGRGGEIGCFDYDDYDDDDRKKDGYCNMLLL